MLVHSHQKAPGSPETDSLAACPILFSGMVPPVVAGRWSHTAPDRRHTLTVSVPSGMRRLRARSWRPPLV
ncbi:hypothetical protein GCM10018793_56050 [Streptomyces sulfonofaciens]|uniref:Uncharacterized protein n=1 Tax=Streptomyces sulfonofaciens TaxID=68272 RepID=A0A919GK85_9ACTN|nr:hypothetical protein GCM10018793_56050 [Streptomyces sulfonofaciens]